MNNNIRISSVSCTYNCKNTFSSSFAYICIGIDMHSISYNTIQSESVELFLDIINILIWKDRGLLKLSYLVRYEGSKHILRKKWKKRGYSETSAKLN